MDPGLRREDEEILAERNSFTRAFAGMTDDPMIVFLIARGYFFSNTSFATRAAVMAAGQPA
jgi:hypothetical protein